MITKDEYKDITGIYPYDGFYLPKIELEDVQKFLISLGYSIVVHKAPWTKEVYQSIPYTGETERVGKEEFFHPRILALKEGETLPDRNDSEEAQNKSLIRVFNKEIRKKLLGF